MSGNRVLFLLLCVGIACSSALAQTTDATLQGTVVDPSDSAVPNVTVDLKNVATGISRTTIAGAEGIFRFNSVDPGIYGLKIQAPAGFKAYQQNQLTLNASEGIIEIVDSLQTEAARHLFVRQQVLAQVFEFQLFSRRS